MDVLNKKQKRKREVEDKLESLNAKKHNLVQVLKQVSFGFILLLFGSLFRCYTHKCITHCFVLCWNHVLPLFFFSPFFALTMILIGIYNQLAVVGRSCKQRKN